MKPTGEKSGLLTGYLRFLRDPHENFFLRFGLGAIALGASVQDIVAQAIPVLGEVDDVATLPLVMIIGGVTLLHVNRHR